MKPTQVVWWIKCLGFTLSVNVLLCVIMLLYAHNILSAIQSLALLCIIGLMALPSYFFVKGSADKTLLYILVTVVSHAVWLVTIIRALGNMFEGSDGIMLSLTIGVSVVLYMVVLPTDLLICVWRRIFK